MKRIHTRILGPVLGLLLALILAPLSGFAQVPHDMAYQGRLTDAVGAPLAGPVDPDTPARTTRTALGQPLDPFCPDSVAAQGDMKKH